jgi:hypothetical protein
MKFMMHVSRINQSNVIFNVLSLLIFVFACDLIDGELRRSGTGITRYVVLISVYTISGWIPIHVCLIYLKLNKVLRTVHRLSLIVFQPILL